ncbi:hypothetical protein jhhlp_000355 [Lomentospora prolificans]|uniref:Translation machinery-associated protein 16 n=1 Tax=Lomentospora prolificans TaxID=41688 RepID=A0A2N3NKQ3_9PEZI|nr:hypothetical protein jhhlp_000355 [Lomentospora prolificans]
MPSSFAKTRKQISKKRDGNINTLHENSRDSKRLHRASVRDERLDKLAASRSRREQPMIDRVSHFKRKVAANGSKPLTQEQVEKLIDEFVHQYDDEFNTIKKARRPGRPASAKEDLLKRKIEALTSEHEAGFLLPDLTAGDNIHRLERWEGNWSYLCTLSWVRVSKAGLIRPSTFLPSSGKH